MGNSDFFQQMMRDAINELASGQKSWRDVEANTLILACFGMLTNHLTSRVVKPLWFFAGSVASGVIWLIVSGMMGI